ncbi:MAG: hypothetical protein ACREQ5_35675, partial [Candidatus Dormibacteria bacterium]
MGDGHWLLLALRRLKGRPSRAGRREYALTPGSVLRKNYGFVYVSRDEALTPGRRISRVATRRPHDRVLAEEAEDGESARSL